jgi:MATE family, multidrug efflux pump
MALRIDERDRRILALAVPALFTLAVEPLYVLVDTAIVGHLGTTPLGGLALSATVLNTMIYLCNFLSFGVTTRVAFETGRGDQRAAARVGVQALWLAAGLGAVLVAVTLLFGHALASALGGNAHVVDAATTYLRISAIGVPAVLVAVAGQGFLRGVADTRTPFAVVLVSNVLNVVLEVAFVYMFHLGIAGSAWGTVIAQLLAAAWFLVLLSRRIIATGATRRPVGAELRTLLGIGRHVVIRTAALLSAFALAASAAAHVGTAALAGHQIAYQMFLLLALTVDALAVAAQALVGSARGAGDDVEHAATSNRLIRLGVIVGAFLTVVVIATSPLVPHLFTGDSRVVHDATIALIGLGLLQVPGAVTFVLDGVLMGASDFGFVKWVTVGALVVYLPFALAVLHWHRLGIVTIWAGLVVWVTARAALNLWRFRSTTAPVTSPT